MLTTLKTDEIKHRPSVDTFLDKHPFFDEKSFLESMKERFLQFQTVRSEGTISKLRAFLSNGLTREIKSNITNNNKSGIKRTHISSHIEKISIDRVEQDGNLHLMYIHFGGKMEEAEYFGKLSLRNKKRTIPINTYWILFRTNQGRAIDTLNCPNCPECGAVIQNNRCSGCGEALNSGRYGWVLSRVMDTQDLLEQKEILRSENLRIRQEVMSQEFPNFTVHELEDTVYNGFLQILDARLKAEANLVRPIFSDRFYEREAMSIFDSTVAYRDVSCNHVTLVAAERLHGYCNIFCNVNFTAQRFDISGRKPKELDSTPVQRGAILHLVRKEPGKNSRGDLYEGYCPSCNFPVSYEVDVNCSKCNTSYNSADTEWIVVDVLSYSKFEEMLNNDSRRFEYAIDPRDLSGLLSIRDYVLNNVMVMCAADLIITTEEVQFIDDVAVMLGYSAEQRKQVYSFLSGSGSLRLRLPDKVEDKRSVLDLMKKAAFADNQIVPEEQRILSYIETEIARDEGYVL